jgi:uncharacterized integral membrane protein
MADPPSSSPVRRNWRFIIGGLVLLLFVAINSQSVTVHFLFTTAQMPLIFALLIAALLGALIGWAIPRLRRPHQ